MDESLKAEINERVMRYLDAIESSATEAGSFIVDQTPLVAQEYLSWYFWEAAIASMASVTGLIGLLVVTVLLCKAVKRNWQKIRQGYNEPLLIIPAAVLGVAFCSCGAIAVTNVRMAVKVTVAPRVVLLEKVQELTR